MPSLYQAHLRHAQYYANLAWQAGRSCTLRVAFTG